MSKLNWEPQLISKRRMDELWLHVLYKCNLSCRHCLFGCSVESEQRGEMSLEECQEHVQAALAAQAKAIYITGGEPLLWSGLKEFLGWYYRQPQIRPLTILTNGTLINRQYAEFFSKYSEQGLQLRVSLECYTQQNHEEYRGSGSFAQAIQGLKNLNAVGIKPWIAYVNKSGGDVEGSGADLLETDFREHLGADHGLEIAGLKIIAAYSKGRFSGQVDFQVEPERITERLDSVQCNYGVAVSREGVFPCPIMVDIPEAKLSQSVPDALQKPISLEYAFCSSCFATGTCCGQ